jgi:peptidoglycan/LPS O-acetylase OafA/YrhL
MASRQRLDQVDAMRPVKQAGVVGTHVLIYFAPAWGNETSNAALLLLHACRETFFFVSACMLTYAYLDLRRDGLRRFYWRRFVAVGIPYLCWDLIYWLWGMRGSGVSFDFSYLLHLLATGYYQLYFLLVIMQFYLLYPLVHALLKRTRGHHGLVIAAAAVAQLGISIATHWQLLPAFWITYAQENALSYVLYLIGGAVVAFHLAEADRWLRRNASLVVALTLLAAIFAEIVYYLSKQEVSTLLGSGSDPFQPTVIPFNIGAIACVYLVGVALVQPWRSRRVKAWVRVGVDNAYGVYLSQLLFITFLNDHGWRNLSEVISWPVVILATVVIVYACGVVLTSLLARTPLAVPLTGRKQVPLRWRPRLPGPGPVRAGAVAIPAADAVRAGAIAPRAPEAATLAGRTDNQNGT